MEKVQKIDFVLKETKDEKIIFRFYPHKSHCYCFNKNFYTYTIVSNYKNNNNVLHSEVLFKSGLDEHSVINIVAEACELVSSGSIENKKSDDMFDHLLFDEIFPNGNGVSWRILSVSSHKDPLYEVHLFNHVNCGYRFYLNSSQLKEFGKYLSKCCEYMLTHSEQK